MALPKITPALPARAASALTVLALALASFLLLSPGALAARGHSAHAGARHYAPIPARCAKRTRMTARGRRTVRGCPRKRVKNTAAVLKPSLPVVSTALAPAGASTLPSAPEGGATHESHPKSRTGEQASGLPGETNGVVTDPIDSRFLTDVPFGTTSFWLQPWRAYLDTWPASTLTSSLGINFNVGPVQAESVAHLLQDSGFTLARKEIPWGALSYEDPTRFTNETRVRAILTALHNHGLRPLILLNANSNLPGPARLTTLTTLAEAPAGATSVQLDAASAAKVVPGKTGFDGLTFGSGPDILITSVGAGDIATLSRPLRQALPAGNHRATTLLYAPFQAPTLSDGAPNPVYEETMAGWLSYVATVNRYAASIFGPEGYDLEVWNELTFGSQFLNYEHYYAGEALAQAREGTAQGDARAGVKALAEDPQAQQGAEAEEEAGAESANEAETGAEASEEAETEESTEAHATSQALEETEAGSGEAAEEGQSEAATLSASQARPAALHTNVDKKVSKQIRRNVLVQTVAYVRDPPNGIPAGVGITDGFASQTPFPSGADAPLGLTALSKHLYGGGRVYPTGDPDDSRPINALGSRDSETGAALKPLFTPSYQALFPELLLTAIHTETVVRDIAPITTHIYGLPHGRNVGPAGGSPVQKWMTEYNLTPGKSTPVGPDGVTPENVTLTAADREHFEAKALLRSLVAMVNKGLSREYFFAAAPGPLSLISKSFYTALEANPETYPGDEAGGETMRGFRNMFSYFQGPGPGSELHQLQLLSIAQEGNHAQFAGDGTAAHPTLYDRDVLAVLPFQSSPTRYVIPFYVMTQDLLTLYQPGQPAEDVSRFDLPDESFRIKLGNLPESAADPTVSAHDPLSDTSTPARLLSREGTSAEFEISATDYPRMLTVEYPGA